MSIQQDPPTGAEWIAEDDEWDDPEWALVVPWYVRVIAWVSFWKR